MAADENWGIGYKGGLPWNRIPEDMKFFKEKTMGHPIIMGRKTMESLGNKFPLDGRVNIVLSNTLKGPGDGSYFVEKRVIDALTTARDRSGVDFENTEAYVIGGSEIFKEFVPMMSGLFVTIVKGNFKSDTFFNPFSNARLIEEVSSKTIRENSKFGTIYLDFRCNELDGIHCYGHSDFIILRDSDGLEKSIKYDEEIVGKTPEDYSKVSLRGIKGMTASDIRSERRLKDNKQKPKDHTYVGGKVSVRELKKYFGVNLVSYGICGAPLKNTEVIYIDTDNHFYLLGNFFVISREKIPYHDSEEISKDEILKSIVKDLHRSTYFADEIMDAYGLDELLDSNGSKIGRYDKIDLTENTLIKEYSNRYSCTVINRNDHTPENYFEFNSVDDFMEKFLIEKWDGYSGQNVRTTPEKKFYLAGDILRTFGLDNIRRKGEFLSEDFIVDFNEYDLMVSTNAEIKTGTIVPKGSTPPYLWKSIHDPHLKIEKFLEDNKEEGMVEEDNPISPSYYESDKIKLREVLDQNLSRVKDGTLAFYLGNTWKYLWRWDRKENPIQDLNKAKKYIEFAVDRLEEINSEEKSTDNETIDRIPPVDIKDLWKMYR